MNRGLVYLVLSLATWVFAPELRRVVDWRAGGFQSIQVLALLPLVALLPFPIMAVRRWRLVPPAMRVAAWAWVGGFLYALVVAVASGNAASGLYEFSMFVLPFGVGLWASTFQADARAAMDVFARFALLFAAISSVYGIFQFVAPPPWDALWMTSVGPVLGGYPVPFAVRVFGTLNAAGPFADFVFASLLLAFGAGRIRTLGAGLQVSACIVALTLSLVRSAWLALAVGIVVYVVLAPGRARAVGVMVSALAFGGVLLTALPAVLGADSVGAVVQQRLASLGDIGHDGSSLSRQEQMGEAAQTFAEAPLGAGLGTIGTATKLSTTNERVTVLDSGFLSRLVEMGIPGFAAYLLGISAVLFGSLRALRAPERDVRNAGALAAAFQVALIALDLSGDAHLGLMGVCCWPLAGLAIAAAAHGRRDGRTAALPAAMPRLGAAW